ncbi:MFS general substrate transporter [Mytilinidion resinicola]|uniref:MFS general substrate transporter n=1 Tax=Mytilinidion resinicola TaxID=574789 RepID=A0A6A6YG69_9PEZI|nr:MFS general substrate transporter [Mytilinidion resinicola]KAF2807568.1 MFS general substrate transporter [Mytilinidion resinicola]
MVNAHVSPLEENVARKNIAHVSPAGIEGNVDVSTKNQSWKSYFWDSWDKSPEERRLIFKLDLTLMTFGCLGTFIKYIDRSNINSAFVSGMKEDLKLYGNQLNYANTAFSIANIIGVWPCNLMLTRSNPKWFIPLLEAGWTICTFAQAAMKTPLQMYVLRTLTGLFETGHYSAIVYLCGAWYQKSELSRRLAIINCATAIGPMFSSYLQAAAYTGLNGRHGMAGWQWLFIVDGVISIGIIIPQCLFYPDVPSRQKPDWVFTEKEIEIARDRNPREGRVKQGRFTRKQMKRWLLTPDIWLLWVISICNSIGNQPSGSMAFWLKAWNKKHPKSFTVPQINNYTTPIQAVTVVVTLFMAWSSDTWLGGRRWPMLVLGGVVNGIVCVLLGSTPVFPKNRAFRWFLYYQTGWAQASNSMFWAWTQDTLSGDPGTRAWASAGLNVWAWTFIATVPLAVFKTTDQPAVVAGNYTAAGFCFLLAITAVALAYLQHRQSLTSGSDLEIRSSVNTDGLVYDDSKSARAGVKAVA